MSEQRAKVTVYRTSTCPFCIAAAQLLDDRGIQVDEVSLDRHPDRRGFTSEILPGHGTVPLVVIDDRPSGGFDALRAMDASGELQKLVFGAS